MTYLNSEGFLSMTVTKNPSASDVTLSLEVTGDLSEWSADGVTIDEDTAIILRGHDNTPIGSAERRFIRLNVTRR